MHDHALADQLVLTLSHQPSKKLVAALTAALRRLNALRLLGKNATPATVAAEVAAVQNQVTADVASSGLAATTPSPSVTQSGTGTTSFSPAPAQGTAPASPAASTAPTQLSPSPTVSPTPSTSPSP